MLFQAREERFTALDFFAGSGLVGLGLESRFTTLWANDICERKAAVYGANRDAATLHVRLIEDIRGQDVPAADLAWASFPCQDLSLAGNLTGIKSGTRSGLFWEWLRVLDEMEAAGKRVPVLLAENVVGFLIAGDGAHFRRAYRALRERGYRAGALVVDAALFVPQSRPRAFLLAVSEETPVGGLVQPTGSEPFHTRAVVTAANAVRDAEWAWWRLPIPTAPVPPFSDLCERNAPYDSPAKTRRLRSLLSKVNGAKIRRALAGGEFLAGTGYRRTRPDEAGVKQQRLEVRFDGVAGCLRTPRGGSSRQTVLVAEAGELHSRLMTVRECARLMGAPDDFHLPGSYNDAYGAMGDAVAVPVTAWLAEHLLAPLVKAKKSATQAA